MYFIEIYPMSIYRYIYIYIYKSVTSVGQTVTKIVLKTLHMITQYIKYCF